MYYQLTAEQVLKSLIEILETGLTELLCAKNKTDFVEGEWYAYIECLEAIFRWKKAEKFGLDYNPESRYKLF